MLTMKNTNALNEKGNLRPAVRKAVLEYVARHPETFASAERFEDKGVFTLAVKDAQDNVFYVNFDVTVSTKAAADRAERKPRAKTGKDISAVEVE